MADRLERLIHLINKTGDKLVVFDRSRPDDAFVISSLEQYERMVKEVADVRGLTEDELIDKINQDIALWKSEQSGDAGFSDFSEDFTEKKRKNAWTIPESRKTKSEQS